MSKEIVLTQDSVETMATLGLTKSEMTDIVGQPLGKDYEPSIKKGRARLAQSLRKAQIASALKGNASLLIWLGKVYLGQRDTQNLELNAEHRAISITPNILDRLQTSYRLTMEQVRQRSGATAPTPAGEGSPGGPLGDREGVLKTTPFSGNSRVTNGEGVEG